MGVGPTIAHWRERKGSFMRYRTRQPKRAFTISRRLCDFFVWLIVGHTLIDVHVRIVTIVVAVHPDRRRGVSVPMIVVGPRGTDDNVATFHGVSFVLAYE